MEGRFGRAAPADTSASQQRTSVLYLLSYGCPHFGFELVDHFLEKNDLVGSQRVHVIDLIIQFLKFLVNHLRRRILNIFSKYFNILPLRIQLF